MNNQNTIKPGMNSESKELLRLAYEAGKNSVALNSDRNARLSQGVRKIEEEYNFDNWYSNQQPESKWDNISRFRLMLGVIG